MLSTVKTIPPAIVVWGKDIEGIKSAIDPPPASIVTAQLPLLYVFTGEATYEWGDDHGVETRTYRIQVAVLPRNQATPQTREKRIRPLIAVVRDAVAARPQLGEVDGVLDAQVAGDSGPALLPEWDMQYLGFEVRVETVSIVERTYARRE